ncbi:zinc-ribbon domain-containing protein [Methanobrevibacter woesei]|uniref:zinc-ribbon domain-containing protein n=1 Tax=Methanobrevibacter woesei TaxID=190976 RepID=UPI0030B91165|nr:zinc-ribbon domain-containing protein [Methanobrevibacter woesei]
MDSKYCPNCGSKNDEFSQSAQINEIKNRIQKSTYYESESKKEIEFLESHVPEDTQDIIKITCPKCGFENNSDSNFCIECGFSFKNSKICSKCGAVSEEGDLFCAECGTKL